MRRRPVVSASGAVTDWPTELVRREAEAAGDSEAFDRVLIGGAVEAPARIRRRPTKMQLFEELLGSAVAVFAALLFLKYLGAF